jgi:hypothetical protein
MLPRCNYELKERTKNMGKKTIKEVLDEAYSNAWTVLMKTLTDNGVKFDDCDATLYVDNPEEKKTYYMNVTLEECDEYGGDD